MENCVEIIHYSMAFLFQGSSLHPDKDRKVGQFNEITGGFCL